MNSNRILITISSQALTSVFYERVDPSALVYPERSRRAQGSYGLLLWVNPPPSLPLHKGEELGSTLIRSGDIPSPYEGEG